MKVGLIGLPKTGKTTIFNALCRQEAEVSAYTMGKQEPNLAVIDVEDERVERLSEMYRPRKTIHATVDLVDFVGVTTGSARTGLFAPSALSLVKQSDALAVVLRNFADPVLDETFGPPNPRSEVETVVAELILADLVVAERRIEHIETDAKRGKQTPATQAEERLLRRIVQALEEGALVRSLDLTEDETKIIQGFQFFTHKPLLAVLNSGEDRYGTSTDTVAALQTHMPCVEFSGNFEMELAQMEDEDARSFMEDVGIRESARERLTRACYELLGYISFFTVGEDEVRAWTVRRDASAVEAAGVIHSDLARGFIRAECFTYEDLMELGSEKAVKERGRLRLEGKGYTVQDGDILHIRFSV
jgi:ribosome-binding ATPase